MPIPLILPIAAALYATIVVAIQYRNLKIKK